MIPSLSALFRLLAFPLLSLAVLILGNGFFTTFVSLRLDLAGTGDEMIGCITASYFAGMLLASFLALSWINRLGHLRVWILLCGANSLIVAAHVLWIDPFYWLFLRFLGGIMMGGFFVVIESWLLLLSSTVQRSLVLAVYVFVYYTATSVGQIFLQFIDPYSWIPYLGAGALSALAIAPCVTRSLPAPAYGQSQQFSLLKTIRVSRKGFFGGFTSGMLLACVYGLAPVYGLSTGGTIPAAGTVMAVIVFGGLSMQLPLGKWADMTNRRKVMTFACFMSALFSFLIAMFGTVSGTANLVLLWVFGGFSFALYPLALAFTCEKIPAQQIVSITSGFNVIYGVGAIAGPVLAPMFMTWFGDGGLFDFIGLICLVMGLVGWEKANAGPGSRAICG